MDAPELRTAVIELLTIIDAGTDPRHRHHGLGRRHDFRPGGLTDQPHGPPTIGPRQLKSLCGQPRAMPPRTAPTVGPVGPAIAVVAVVAVGTELPG